MAVRWLLAKLLRAFPCKGGSVLLMSDLGATVVKGQIMGFAISACAPAAAAQFHPAPAAVQPKPTLVTKPPPQPAITPVTPPASAEAIMMENARHPDAPAGIEFDDVPFQDDTVLSDDIIRPDPVAAKPMPPTRPQNPADCAPMLPD